MNSIKTPIQKTVELQQPRQQDEQPNEQKELTEKMNAFEIDSNEDVSTSNHPESAATSDERVNNHHRS